MPAFPLKSWFLVALTSSLLSACGGSNAPVTSAADASTTNPASSPAATTVAGQWASAQAGDILDVTLGDLKPTQGALGFDQIYYKLGRYELDPEKEFDDYCSDEGLTGVADSGYTTSSTLTDTTTFSCSVTDANRDTSVLNPVVIGPNGDTLYLLDGHHGMSSYYQVANGGPTVHVHVVVKANLSQYAGDAFWTQMTGDGYDRLKNGDGNAITAAQLPTALGLNNGMTNDKFRSLVYFTRDIGYSVPDDATDFLEFYWADWLRASFPLSSYDLTRLGTITADPATDDNGYLDAVWNASALMVASSDPVIDGLSGATLGRLAEINNGKAYKKSDFGDLMATITASKPGKLAYALYWKTEHGLN